MNPVWLVTTAVVIGGLIRSFKDDTRLPTIPPTMRFWVALSLGAVSGGLEAIALGTPWKTALGTGVSGAVTAILAHEGLVESARNGKELPIPAVMKEKAP